MPCPFKHSKEFISIQTQDEKKLKWVLAHESKRKFKRRLTVEKKNGCVLYWIIYLKVIAPNLLAAVGVLNVNLRHSIREKHSQLFTELLCRLTRTKIFVIYTVKTRFLYLDTYKLEKRKHCVNSTTKYIEQTYIKLLKTGFTGKTCTSYGRGSNDGSVKTQASFTQSTVCWLSQANITS